jgi:hypothetical protein
LFLQAQLPNLPLSRRLSDAATRIASTSAETHLYHGKKALDSK